MLDDDCVYRAVVGKLIELQCQLRIDTLRNPLVDGGRIAFRQASRRHRSLRSHRASHHDAVCASHHDSISARHYDSVH